MDEAQLETMLATVHALLQAEGLAEAAQIVRAHQARISCVDHDNWNGGTDIWEVYFEVPAEAYAALGVRRDDLEKEISDRIGTVLKHAQSDWYAAKIVPAPERRKEWRSEHTNLPRATRRHVIDEMNIEFVPWCGDLDEVAFLSRLYDLESLPSHDPRYNSAVRDIWQHCINNDDWAPDWVFSDTRFRLMDGPAESFLKFLCEMVHPIVRPQRNEALKLVARFNAQLQGDGWAIVEEEPVAGRPRFVPRPLTHQGGRALARGRTVADTLEAGAMARAIDRMERAIDTDPDLAIGTAKELVESCCKTILAKRGINVGKSDDLGDLTKRVARELNLVPDGVTNETKGADNIRRILQNLTQLTHHLAELRGLYGTGHGRDGAYRGLQPRHARLAVAAAIAFADFIAETDRHRSIKATAD